MTTLAEVWQRFLRESPGDPAEVRVFFAPGRVNLIGEHLDYNGGWVLPAALEMGTWAFVRPRVDGVLRFISTSFPGVVQTTVDDLVYQREDGFANYPKGVLWALREAGVPLYGADFLFHGNLPSGAGLSSSASIGVVTAAAMNALAGAGLDRVTLARLAQRGENEFVGVQCGIMDQFAVAAGVRDRAMLLDCATLDYRWVQLHLGPYVLVITNSNKVRGLADSKYNERRAECEQALALLQRVCPGLRQLAGLSPAKWAELESAVPDPVLRRRVRHVVTENDRVLRAAASVERGDLETFGRLLCESHVSLRDDYEVTGPELDALAAAAWDAPGCIGSRMTGAGFGGCTVSLVRRDAVEAFTAWVAERYRHSTGLSPAFYVTDIGDGVREVTEEVREQCRSL